MSRLDDMFGYLPEYLREFEEIRQIITAEEPEFDRLVQWLETTLNNMFISTATEMGLEKYESLLNIKSTLTDIETRRANVMALWFSDMPFTIRALKERLAMIQGNSNVDAWVEKNNYLLHVKTDLSTAEEIGNARIIIDNMKPANLGLKFDFESIFRGVTAWYGIAALYNTSTILKVEKTNVSALTWFVDELNDPLMDESGIILFE